MLTSNDNIFNAIILFIKFYKVFGQKTALFEKLGAVIISDGEKLKF